MEIFDNYFYQIFLALLVAFVFVSTSWILIGRLLIRNDEPLVKRKFLRLIYLIGVIPLWAQIVHFIPFKQGEVLNVLSLLPTGLSHYIAHALNTLLSFVYSPWIYLGFIGYFTVFLAFIWGPIFIERTSHPVLKHLVYVILTFGLYLPYLALSYLYDPRTSQRIKFGKLVYRDHRQALRAIRGLVASEKEPGIKIHPYIHASFRQESQHFFFVGGAGSGKTNAINQMIADIRTRQDRVIIYDRKGDYTESFGEEAGTILLSPFDVRGCSWAVAKDIRTPIMAEEFAAAVIPIPKDTRDPVWHESAQDLFTGVVVKLQREKGDAWGFSDLELILSKKDEVIKACADHWPGALHTIGDPGDKQTAGVFMNLRVATKKMGYLAQAWKDCKQGVSLLEWVHKDQHPIRTIIMGGNSKYPGLDNFLVTQSLNLIYAEALSLPDSHKRRLWTVNDEQGSQPKVKNLLRALAEGRSKGLCIISAVQDIGQIRDVWGRDLSQTWFTNYGTIWGGRISDPDTASFLARAFGQIRVEKTSVSIAGEKISHSKAEYNEAALLDSDFLNLPNASLKGGSYFWLRVGDWPAAKLKYDIKPLPKRYEALIPMAWLNPTVPMTKVEVNLGSSEGKADILATPYHDFHDEIMGILDDVKEEELQGVV